MDMDATSNNITSEDSILVSLNKTRELWSSKADVSLATAKVPKPQMVKPGSRSSSSNSDIRSNERPADVVSSDDLVVEDFELPDIRGIKSQWETVESPNKEVGVPMPFAKSPAEVARERERSARRQKMQEKIVEAPEQQQDETYRIELGKLKAQFESKSSGQTSNKPLSPQRTSSFKRSALKDTNKFKDKVDVMEVPAATNGYHNEVCEEASVDLASIKSQFESRKDEMPLSPARQVDKKPDSVPASVAPPNDQPEREIVRSSEPIADENYEVEMGALRKMFERKPAADISPQKPPHIAQIRKTPADIKTTKYTPTKETEAAVSEPVVTAIESGSTMNTPVKSSEPMHEEMIGEESVKDRLERFKAIASPNAPAPSPENHKRASRKSSVARKDSLASVSSEERQQQHQQEAEVVRSPPAGTPESIQRAPSLRETKALFQSQVDKSSELLSRRRSSSRDTSRSSSRRSSRSRSTTSSVSRRSQSPSSRRKASLSVGSDVADMTEVVQSSPAGVKEQVNVTPTLKVSAAKSVFEVKGKPSGDDGPAATPQPRRQLRADWTSDPPLPKVKDQDANIPETSNGKTLPDPGSFGIRTQELKQ